MGIPLYRQWGQLAVGPYAVAAAVMAVVAVADGRPGSKGRTGPDPGRPGRPVAGGPGGGLPDRPVRGDAGAAGPRGGLGARRGTPPSTSSPRCWWWSRPGSGPPTARTRTRWSTGTGTSSSTRAPSPTYELYYPYLPGMVIFGFSSVQQGRGPADRRPHPVPLLHRARDPVRPQPAAAARPTPGSGPSRSSPSCPPPRCPWPPGGTTCRWWP